MFNNNKEYAFCAFIVSWGFFSLMKIVIIMHQKRNNYFYSLEEQGKSD